MSKQEHAGPFSVAREGRVAMVTRDGITLRSDVYRPAGPGPWPVLLRRTPYGNRVNDLAEEFNEAHLFASHGYLVVVQDTRGRFSSDGQFSPLVHEGEDGYDAVEWAAGLEGSNGDVGMFGQSYGCIAQYQAAVLRPPHLRVCAPLSGKLLAFGRTSAWYSRGMLELSWILSYLVNMAEETLRKQGREAELGVLDDLKVDPSDRFSPLKDETLRALPLSGWIDRLGDLVPFLGDLLGHDVDGPYWWWTDISRRLPEIEVPMLHIGSWYDMATADTIEAYSTIKERGATERARRGQALLMGPWAHLLPYNQPTRGGTGEIDFGPEAEVFLLDAVLDWFDHHLKRGGDGLGRTPVRIFVMGENRWRDEPAWPPPAARAERWHLHSGGAANTVHGDGTLSREAPGAEPADTYRYDPADPVPSRGGHRVGGGVADQRPNLERPDVLVFTSAPVEADTELTGPVTARLFVASSAVDTDVVAVLSDVRPDGYTHNLLEGSVRLRFLESFTSPTLIEPGRTYEVALDLWSTSHVLAAGHRLRLHVTSSDFPRWARNLNTGEGIDGTRMVVAEQSVFHDAERPSSLTVSIVPRTS